MTDLILRNPLWRLLLKKCICRPALSDWERAVAKQFVRQMNSHLTQGGVAITPLIVLRVHDVMMSLLAVLRIEDSFAGETVVTPTNC